MSVPVPPVRDPGTRYPATMLVRARELYATEVSVSEIGQQLVREFGAAPTATALRSWVDDSFAERDRARRRRNTARWRRSALTDAQLLALRLEDGMSYEMIVKVAHRFYGVSLTVSQVRHRLGKLGAPTNPLKARPPRVSA